MLEIRQSAVRTYLRCPLQYYFRYVKGLIRPPAVAALTGTATHKATEIFWREKRKQNKDYPDTIPFDLGYDAATKVLEDGLSDAIGDDSAKNEARRNLPGLVNGAFQSVVLPDDMPLIVEGAASVIIENVRITGTIDLITDDNVCWDHKTGKRYVQKNADTSLQLAIYGLMAQSAGLSISTAGLVWIRENLFLRFPTVLSEQKLDRAKLLVASVVNAIKRGDFPPCNIDSNDVWWCSPKWCGYHQNSIFGGPCQWGL